MAVLFHFSKPPSLSSHCSPNTFKTLIPNAAVRISNSQTRERQRMKQLFKEARERCINEPMDGVSFTVEDFLTALDKNSIGTDVGCKVKGTIVMTNIEGAFVDIGAKCCAFLPLQEACLHKINHLSDAGIYPGLQDEFVVIGENTADDSLILSLRLLQTDLSWERCQQLHIEDSVVTGKVIGGNKGGVMVAIEGLLGFVPYSEMSKNSTLEGVLNKELLLKFLMVDRKQSQLILSNRKAMVVNNQEKIEIGSVVKGTVRSLKPYGALIDIGEIYGLLHISQISHDLISNISTILQPGDILKVMIICYDHERGRLSLSTKKLEPSPGDMIRNPKLVFEKAEEVAENFKQRIAWVEEMAYAELLTSQPEIQ